MQHTLSITEAAQALSVGRTKFYELIQRQDIRTIRVGRRRLVVASDVAAFVERALATEASS